MTNFREGYFYYFKSIEAHSSFTRHCFFNREFANFVSNQPFKVLELGEFDEYIKVANRFKETKIFDLSSIVASDYFNIDYSKAWTEGAGYQLKNAEAFFKASSINGHFIQTIGYNPFIVESVELSNSNSTKTMRLKYVDPNDRSKFLSIRFTLSEHELEHFEEWKRPICSGFIRGNSIINELPVRDSRFTKPCDEIELPEADNGLTTAEMADIENEISTIKPKAPEFKIEVHGKINMVIDDEFTRLKAIEFLNNMVFK